MGKLFGLVCVWDLERLSERRTYIEAVYKRVYKFKTVKVGSSD